MGTKLINIKPKEFVIFYLHFSTNNGEFDVDEDVKQKLLQFANIRKNELWYTVNIEYDFDDCCEFKLTPKEVNKIQLIKFTEDLVKYSEQFLLKLHINGVLYTC